MQKSQEYLTVIGLFVLVGVSILLLSSPEDIFSSMMVIDVSQTQKTEYEMLVTTVFDFKKTEELDKLPKIIGGMESRDLEITESEHSMGAVLKRMYSQGNRSVLFILLSSQNMSEFHNLEICYSGSWNLTENVVEGIKAQKLGEAGFDNIHVNKFLIRRGDLEMVVLHWFMWDGGVVRSDKNFMLIQVATPVDQDRQEAIDSAENFTKDFFLTIYKPVAKTKKIGEQIIDVFGVFGYLIDAVLILIPLLMIFNASISKK